MPLLIRIRIRILILIKPVASEGATSSTRPPHLLPNIRLLTTRVDVTRWQPRRPLLLHNRPLHLAPQALRGPLTRKTFPAPPPIGPHAGVARPPSNPEKLTRRILLPTAAGMPPAATSTRRAQSTSHLIGTWVASGGVQIIHVRLPRITFYPRHPLAQGSQRQQVTFLQHLAPPQQEDVHRLQLIRLSIGNPAQVATDTMSFDPASSHSVRSDRPESSHSNCQAAPPVK